MISPRTPLVLLAAFLFLPAATILFAVPTLTAVSSLLLIALVLIAAIDAAVLQPDFSALDLVVPDVVRLSKGRECAIDIKVTLVDDVHQSRKQAKTPNHFRLGIPFPVDLGAAFDEFDIDLPASGSQSYSISCQPKQRGRFVLDKYYVRASTRLRLWNLRRALPMRCEVRVYPDLLLERRNFSALFLRRGMFGFRQHRQVGKGREFEKLREYIPGDSAEDVHWKATAKRGHPVTKVFQIERTQEVYVIVDFSRLSVRSSAGMPMLERYINSALILCLAAAKQNDLFGLTTFSDSVQKFVRAKNGKAHYDLCRDALYTLQPQAVTPDFEDLFTFLRLRLRRRALLVFFTALDDPALAESFVGNVDLLTRQHLVLVNMIQPPEAQPMFANPNVSDLDDVYRQLGGHLVWNELQEIRKRLQRLGAEFSLVSSDKLASEAVSHYLQVKQRQLL
jgi:uncharacterized protein (DUF58 family)